MAIPKTIFIALIQTGLPNFSLFCFFGKEKKKRRKEIFREEFVSSAYEGETMVRFFNQDHTLGMLMRMSMESIPNVVATGYREPRPFEDFLEMTIQTTSESTAQQVVHTARRALTSDVECLEKLVMSQFAKR